MYIAEWREGGIVARAKDYFKCKTDRFIIQNNGYFEPPVNNLAVDAIKIIKGIIFQ